MCSINHDLKLIFIHTPKIGGLYISTILQKLYGFETYYFTHENHSDFMKDCKNVMNNEGNGCLNITKGGILRYYMSSKNHNSKMKMNDETWRTYKKITVIRNPYDRFISTIKYLVKRRSNNMRNMITEHDGMNEVVKTLDMDEINRVKVIIKNYISNINDINIVKSYDYFHAFITQYEQLLNLDNEIKIDYFIRFEHLNSDFCDVLLKCGIEKIRHRTSLLNNYKINETSNINFYHFYDQDILDFINETFDNDFKSFDFKKAVTLDELFLESKKYHKDIEDFVGENIKLLIDLDEKNLIFTNEELKDFNLKNNTKIHDDTNVLEESNNNRNNTNNNILLPNGIQLNYTQNERTTNNDSMQFNYPQNERTTNNDSMQFNYSQNDEEGNFHLNNIIKLFNKMAEKYKQNSEK
jgi:hypothetical protein